MLKERLSRYKQSTDRRVQKRSSGQISEWFSHFCVEPTEAELSQLSTTASSQASTPRTSLKTEMIFFFWSLNRGWKGDNHETSVRKFLPLQLPETPTPRAFDPTSTPYIPKWKQVVSVGKNVAVKRNREKKFF